jgi:hypothetical protein
VKRLSLAVQKALPSGSSSSGSEDPPITSLSSTALDLEDFSSSPNNQQQLNRLLGSDSIDSVTMEPLELTENVQKQQQLSWLMNVLENPSLKIGRLITLGAAAVYGTNFATVKLLDDALPLSVSVSFTRCHLVLLVFCGLNGPISVV